MLLQYLETATQDSHTFVGNDTVGVRHVDGEINGRHRVWSFKTSGLTGGTAVFFAATPAPEPGSIRLFRAGSTLASLSLRRKR